MALRLRDDVKEKLARWSLRHGMSQNAVMNLILDAVDDLVIEGSVTEIRTKAGGPDPDEATKGKPPRPAIGPAKKAPRRVARF